MLLTKIHARVTVRTRAANFSALGRVGLIAAFSLASGAVVAVTISPVIVELSPVRKVVSVTVSNPSDSAVSFQADVLEWSQPDGYDRYAESDDIMVVPPIATIAAGASQIFRVTPRTPSGAREQAYRLILEDVTPEPAGAAEAATVNIRVRHSLPVFVASAAKPVIAMSVAQCAAPAGTGCVRLNNDGERYVIAKTLVIEGGAWRKEVVLGTRLLAGAWREWNFNLPANVAGPLTVKAETSAGIIAGAYSAVPR